MTSKGRRINIERHHFDGINLLGMVLCHVILDGVSLGFCGVFFAYAGKSADRFYVEADLIFLPVLMTLVCVWTSCGF